MAQDVYSTSFYRGVVDALTNVVYTVPAGRVAVLRTITLGYAITARAGGVLTILLSASNSRVYVATLAASTVASSVWQGNVVLPAGEQLRAATTATGVQYLTLSGYLLGLP